MSGDTDGELDEKSRRLLHSIDEMRSLEDQKRRSPRSSPEFHDLAEEVEHKALEVWDMASRELDGGREDSPLADERSTTDPGDWTG